MIVGFGRAGTAAAQRCVAEGIEVIAIEDRPSEVHRSAALALGVPLVESPSPSRLGEVLEKVEAVIPSPGVSPSHALFSLVEPRRVMSEVDLALRLAGPDAPPLVAVTGTNGKTTVTTLITDMLRRSGLSVAAAGNIGMPLIEAHLEGLDAVVLEMSSFQLVRTQQLAPAVGLWLNVAPDHLDWHSSMADYVAAKARIWSGQSQNDLAIGNADDPVVAAALAHAPGRKDSFGLAGGRWTEADGWLVGPDGPIFEVASMRRSLPLDRRNALAAAAAAFSVGADREAVAGAIAEFSGLAHRIQFVAEHNGVCYYDDSKATTPDAVLAGVEGFASVVLIAGGRNKGLDLSPLREAAGRLRAVICLGEAAEEIAKVFSSAHGGPMLEVVSSMPEAVAEAARLARPGDVVLLSPGCTSYDRYVSYAARGEHFVSCVKDVFVAPQSRDKEAM